MKIEEARKLVNKVLEKEGSVHKSDLAQELAQLLVDQLHKTQELDGKFHGRIFRNRDGKEEENFIVFVPRDRFLPKVLDFYHGLCHEAAQLGETDHLQFESVYRLRRRVERWQAANQDKVKTPDCEPGETP